MATKLFFLHLSSPFTIMPKSSKTTENNDLKVTALFPTLTPTDEPTSTSPTAKQIKWVANKGLYFPFSETTGDDVVEFQIKGTVIEPYLKGGPSSFSHSVSLELTNDKIESIKSYIYKAPNYIADTYRLPLDGTIAKFVSEENVSRPFREVWEISDERLVRNEDLRSSISVDRIK